MSLHVACGRRSNITDAEASQYLEAHPENGAKAPAWARSVDSYEVFEDDQATFAYVFADDKFEVREAWYVETNGSLTYGLNNDDEPEITCYGDALFDIVSNYIEGKNQ